MAQTSSNPNDLGCATFKLPDGDRVLITWPYVVSKLTEVLAPIIDSITLENQSLKKIEDKLDQWLEEGGA